MHKKKIDKEAQHSSDENRETNGNIDINTDESLSGSSHLNEPVSEESEVEKLKAELDEQKDKFVRKVAEFENFKRRNARERMELIQTAGREVITDLLKLILTFILFRL